MLLYTKLKEIDMKSRIDTMKEFEGHVEPELKQFLEYDGADLSANIGESYKEGVVIEMVKDGADSYVSK
jgi:hypothetical protein